MNVINIIQNTLVNPLSYDTSLNLSLNHMSKLDKRYPVFLIDTSYWLYYRFFSLRNWYNKAYPQVQTNVNFNLEHNWLEDQIFMTKYQKLFIDNILTLCKKNKTIISNVIFCIDCSHKDNWRLENNETYKGTRLESHSRNQFNSYELFNYIKKTYIPQLQVLYGIKTLYNNHCEADDIIGHFAPFLIHNGFTKVIILANDNDYLQICKTDHIIMIDGKNNILNKHNLEYGIKYLLKKILLGDTSDNIKCCSINTNTITNLSNLDIQDIKDDTTHYKNINKTLAQKLINDITSYTHLQKLLYDIRNGNIDTDITYIKNFYNNARLMDFALLPSHLQKELYNKFINFI